MLKKDILEELLGSSMSNKATLGEMFDSWPP